MARPLKSRNLIQTFKKASKRKKKYANRNLKTTLYKRRVLKKRKTRKCKYKQLTACRASHHCRGGVVNNLEKNIRRPFCHTA